MKPPPRIPAALLFLLAGATADAALSAGGTAYTKKLETAVLSEPSPLAASTGKLGFGRSVKITEARGVWLKIADGEVSGWVFAGNLSENKPNESKGLDGLGLQASQTAATAAARPLTPAANAYADQHNLGDAREDLNWLGAQCHAITADQVDAFLREKKKGEYQ